MSGKPSNLERIRRARDELLLAAGLLDAVLDRDMSLSDAGERLGMSPQILNHALETGFRHYVRQRTVDVDELYRWFEAARPASDAVILAVAGAPRKDCRLFAVPAYDHGKFQEIFQRTLTAREQEVTSLMAAGKTQRKAGDGIGVSPARAQQIYARSINRLRSAGLIQALFPVEGKENPIDRELIARARENTEKAEAIARDFAALHDLAELDGKAMDAFRVLCAACDRARDAAARHYEPDPDSIPLETVRDRLSGRTYRAMIRSAKYPTLLSVASDTATNVARRVPNVGAASISELRSLIRAELGDKYQDNGW